MHGNQYLITDVLKGELGFTGFVVSDWNGIDQIDGATGFTAAEVATADQRRHRHGHGAQRVAARSSRSLRSEVQAGRVPMSRIDDANRRILTKKFELGLFERPLHRPLLHRHRGQRRPPRRWPARRCAKSQVLLKNAGDVLPLAKTGDKIFVAGKSADNIGYQSGGWTISWQGGSGDDHAGHDDPAGHPGRGRRRHHGHLQRRRARASTPPTGRPSRWSARRRTPRARATGPARWAWTPTDLTTIDTAARRRAYPSSWCWSRAGRWTSPRSCPTGTRWSRRGCPAPRAPGSRTCCSATTTPTGKLPVTWMQSASQQPINDGDGKTPLFPYGFGLKLPDHPGHPYSVIGEAYYDVQRGTRLERCTDSGCGQSAACSAPATGSATTRGLRHHVATKVDQARFRLLGDGLPRVPLDDPPARSWPRVRQQHRRLADLDEPIPQCTGPGDRRAQAV